jgi:hypothetical protein
MGLRLGSPSASVCLELVSKTKPVFGPSSLRLSLTSPRTGSVESVASSKNSKKLLDAKILLKKTSY